MDFEIFMVNLLVDLSDYGPTFLVTARCGPACRVVWEGGGLKPPSYPSYTLIGYSIVLDLAVFLNRRKNIIV